MPVRMATIRKLRILWWMLLIALRCFGCDMENAIEHCEDGGRDDGGGDHQPGKRAEDDDSYEAKDVECHLHSAKVGLWMRGGKDKK